MSLRIISLAFLANALATPFEKVSRDSCNPCNPRGATGTNPPSVGPDISSLYTDILASVKDIHFDTRSANPVEARDDDFCCAETLDCVNVQNLNIPMCYDKFTTNFAFADRSYGSLTTGEYTQGSAEANLLTGQYSADGSEGDIYSKNPVAKPNTATLAIPPQWTGPGVGSAIPATAIVGSATVPGQASVQMAATALAESSGQSTASSGTAASQATGSGTSSSGASASQSTGSKTSSGEVASSTSTPGAAIQGSPSLLMMGLAALFYAV